jgi:hypothetical protein
MSRLGPRTTHLLDQYIAFTLEVNAKVKDFQANLIAMGWPEAEAWAQAQRLEERIMTPVMDYTEKALPVEEKIDELIAQRLEELGPQG